MKQQKILGLVKNLADVVKKLQKERLEREAEAAQNQSSDQQREVLPANHQMKAKQVKLLTEDKEALEQMLELEEAYDEIQLFSTSRAKSPPTETGFHIAGFRRMSALTHDR